MGGSRQGKEIVAAGGQMAGRTAASDFRIRIDARSINSVVFHSIEAQCLDKTPSTGCALPTRAGADSAAAYIWSERAFEAYVLKGGLAATEAAPSHGGEARCQIVRGEGSRLSEPGAITEYKARSMLKSTGPPPLCSQS